MISGIFRHFHIGNPVESPFLGLGEMAGVIPRVLPRRSTGFEQEREEFEKTQVILSVMAIFYLYQIIFYLH